MMLIGHKIDMRIWESGGTMGKNGERVIPGSYLTKFFEL
jgi:hypothetical protein